MSFGYTLLAQDGPARRGRIDTPHGPIETPAFMPVGTVGSVKAMAPEEVEATGAHCVLGNTYHLWLRPGHELIEKLGGLHAFMRWPRAMLTDSGGFQVFSLASMNKIDDDGVTFKSHVDGGPRRLTPEISVAIQEALGADIAMAFDQCAKLPATRDELIVAMNRTTAWAKRCLAARKRDGQALFGIVQGGTDLELRKRHVDELCTLPFEGFALGGLSVGEPAEERDKAVREIAPRMPQDRPRYLMGVGSPEDLVVCSGLGIDMYDCVLPTRNARNGHLLTRDGRVIIKNAGNRDSQLPIEEGCDCPTCAKYDRAYLRHLFLAGEILAMRLLTAHNLHFTQNLMKDIRLAIEEKRYEAFARDFLARRQPTCATRHEPAAAT